jgi:hypothetical protein
MISYSSIKVILRNSLKSIVWVFLLLVLFQSSTSCTSIKNEASSPVLNSTETHYIPMVELGDASRYWNTAWLEHTFELYDEILTLTTNYFQTHQYVFGEKDCNDMAVDVWHKLIDKEIISLIVVGNLEKSYETFLECNHAWLMVYSSKGSAAAMDLTRGKVYVWEDVRTNPQLRQYWEGFVYASPSDLLVDFKDRW